MQVMSNGRVRRTEEEWREVFSRWERSGQTPRDFCRKRGVELSSFLRWRQKLNGSSVREAFVTLTAPPPRASSWRLKVTLPDGSTLRFQG